MSNEIEQYNELQSEKDQRICNRLKDSINSVLTEAESKNWHGHPVWFLEGNPIVGYSKLKDLTRWLNKSREIQWDYKNIAKRQGVLERLSKHGI